MPLLLPIFVSFLLGQGAAAPTLPAFPAGWPALVEVKSETRSGEAIAQLPAKPADQPFIAANATLIDPPGDQEFHFNVYLRRSEGSDEAEINCFAYSADKKYLYATHKVIPLKSKEWTKVDASTIAPAGTKRLVIWVINSAAKPLDVSSPSLTLGEHRIIALDGSGVLRASSQTIVTGTPGEVRFPVPSPYRDQAPLTFKLTSSVPSALKSWKLTERSPRNWICVAQVTPPKDQIVKLRWESLVLVRQTDQPVPPKAGFGPFPAEAKAWLGSSPVAQSDDPRIVAKAKELKTGCTDVESFARNVIKFTSLNQGTGEKFVALDAKSAMGCGGSCTSRANLATALLRAGGVPARSVPHLPTWAYGQPLYEHWLVEYWHPGTGWVWVESTMGIYQPKPSTLAALGVSSIEDERAAGTQGQYSWIMHGAAWMSGIQGFGGLQAAGSEDEGNGSWCRPERRLAVDSSLFESVSKAWPLVDDRAYVELMDKAAMTGTLQEITRALSKRFPRREVQ